MGGIRDVLEDAYDGTTDRFYEFYTDDRIREVQEASVLAELSESGRYERLARHDAGVLRRFDSEREQVSTTEELDELYGSACDELELTGEPLVSLPSREELRRDAPRTVTKFAVRRVFSAPAAMAVDVEYGIGNTLRRARKLEEDGAVLEAELMAAAAIDRIPLTDPETSADRLEGLYEERREELDAGDGSLRGMFEDLFAL